MRSTVKRWGVALGCLLCLGTAAAGGPWLWARAVAAPRTATADTVPAFPVALVLGAQAYADGTPSPMLAARLDVAADLYRRGKVRVLLVSGAAGANLVNEPDVMRAELIARGVPDGRIVRDYAGFDTYSSCVRADRVFGVRRLVVVSQGFHIPRAVAICRTVGVDAWGVGDYSTRQRAAWGRGERREVGASLKMVWDLFTHRTPVLGPREEGVSRALEEG